MPIKLRDSKHNLTYDLLHGEAGYRKVAIYANVYLGAYKVLQEITKRPAIDDYSMETAPSKCNDHSLSEEAQIESSVHEHNNDDAPEESSPAKAEQKSNVILEFITVLLNYLVSLVNTIARKIADLVSCTQSEISINERADPNNVVTGALSSEGAHASVPIEHTVR